MYVGPIIENQCTAGLFDVEATYAMATVSQQVSIGQMPKIVRALSHFNYMREANDQLNQARCRALDGFRIVQHDADSTQGVPLQKPGQQVEACPALELQSAEVAIEDQQFALSAAQNRIASLPVLGLTGE